MLRAVECVVVASLGAALASPKTVCLLLAVEPGTLHHWLEGSLERKHVLRRRVPAPLITSILYCTVLSRTMPFPQGSRPSDLPSAPGSLCFPQCPVEFNGIIDEQPTAHPTALTILACPPATPWPTAIIALSMPGRVLAQTSLAPLRQLWTRWFLIIMTPKFSYLVSSLIIVRCLASRTEPSKLRTLCIAGTWLVPGDLKRVHRQGPLSSQKWRPSTWR